MPITRIHYLSGLLITIFIGLHLFNHFCSIFGAEKHLEVMKTLRPFYRNVFAETLLMIAVLVQIISGIKLFNLNRKIASTYFEKLHIWSGLYLAIFFVIHLSAIFVGRFYLKLDTNFYYAVAGVNSFPLNLFFIPYYALAIIAFFGHLAAIHNKKMKHPVMGVSPGNQAILIFFLGFSFTFIIFYGLTNHFNGVPIPPEYKIQIGK